MSASSRASSRSAGLNRAVDAAEPARASRTDAAMPAPSRPRRRGSGVGLAVRDVLDGHAEHRRRRRARPASRLGERVGDGGAGAADADAVLDGDDQPVARRRRRASPASSGLTTRTSHTVAVDALGGQQVGGLLARPRPSCRRRGGRRRVARRARCRAVSPVPTSVGVDLAGRALGRSGSPPGRRASSASRSITFSSWADDGANTVMPGIVRHSAMSSTPWCDGAVVAGDAGAVEGEHDRQAVQADVEVGLVEGPGEERRVHGDDRPQPAHGHARGRGDGVLLGDADVEEAVGEALPGTAAGPVGPGIAAVMAMTCGCALGQLDHAPR